MASAPSVPVPGPVLVQLSDLHVGSPHLAGRGVPAIGPLRRVLAAVDALGVTVDLVLATGDLTDHGRPEEYRELLALLDSWGAPVVLLPGNHDDPAVLRALLADRQPMVADLPGVTTAVDHLGPIRVLALDSWDGPRDGGRVGSPQLAWLHQQLSADARPTVVAVHHPPAPIGHQLLDTMHLDDGNALGDVVAQHPHVVRVVCGHAHRAATFGWRGTVVSVAPSTVRQFAPVLHPSVRFAYADESPAFLVHAWVDGTLVTHVIGIDTVATPEEVA